MTNPLESTILTMIVTTASGAVREHLLDLGIGKESAVFERMRARVRAIEERMNRGESITLEHPATTYNCPLIESVRYEIRGASKVAGQIRQAMTDASRQLGFDHPARTNRSPARSV
jgi:hypothetical protein